MLDDDIDAFVLISGRDHSEDRNEIIDVDPELIKKGIRNLMHEVCQIEREKVCGNVNLLLNYE